MIVGGRLRAIGVLMVMVAAPANAAQGERVFYEEIRVIGARTDLDRVPGSGTLIDAAQLERIDETDLHQVLSQSPGVYLREEDGYGLRPNIGIRGAAADRSSKITIMEDGVLIAPAPYSAPAAYYVPNVARVSEIEVLKGPSAIAYGPHTVGGAINFISEPVPLERSGRIDVSAGSDGFYKYEGSYGDARGPLSFLLQGLTYGADGFKELDGSGDTGFERTDVSLKLRYEPQRERDQALTVRLAYANEDADETYLGLTDADFKRNPLRRYRASQLARFRSEHYSVTANYALSWSDTVQFNIKGYRHEFDREWNKLDGFFFGAGLPSILERPDLFAAQFAILTGEQNSLPTEAQTLDVTKNDRQFVSQGLQLSVSKRLQLGEFDHQISVGLRVHNDQVERDHQPVGYLMTDGILVADGIDRLPKVLNEAETDALAIHVMDVVEWDRLRVTAGVRFEQIDGELTDFRGGSQQSADQSAVLPGLGAHWQWSDRLGLLAGVYRGFSPAGPGSGADPEETLNYELGIRYRDDRLAVDVVGFFSDYDNLIGRCRVSDTGCDPGEEFNGGAVEVSGLELSGRLEWPLLPYLTLTTDLAYTFTDSSFESSFLSGFVQWGLVTQGDELPYLPEHVGRLQLGLNFPRFDLTGILKWQSTTREVPGQGDVDDALHADGFAVLDLTASFHVRESLSLQLKVQNLTDEAVIVSHRPFGARPNRPRTIIGRVSYRF